MKKMLILTCLFLFLIPLVWAQEKVEAPVWNVGDKWTYKSTSGGTWTTEVVDAKEDLYIVRTEGVQDLNGYDKKTMNVTYLIEQSGRKVKATSSFKKLFDFPLLVGKKWTDRTYGKPAGGTLEVTYINDFRIEGIEQVTTPAGTFKAYIIHFKQTNMAVTSGTREGWIRYWYSPDVKTWIKREVEKSSFWASVRWLQDAELTSFSLK
jgi:hypothetical protein